MKPLAALRALGTGGEAPTEAKQRVYAALLGSLESAAAVAAVAARLPKASASLTTGATPAVVGVVSTKVWLIAAGIWLIGGATGAALYGALQHERVRVRVVYIDRLVPASPLPAASMETDLPANAALPGATALPQTNEALSKPTIPTKRASSDPSQLARERALLDSARAHAARGEPELALERAEEHRRLFPRGKLSEEREALAIRALLARERVDEARARASAFRTAHPDSFLAPVIDSALNAP